MKYVYYTQRYHFSKFKMKTRSKWYHATGRSFFDFSGSATVYSIENSGAAEQCASAYNIFQTHDVLHLPIYLEPTVRMIYFAFILYAPLNCRFIHDTYICTILPHKFLLSLLLPLCPIFLSDSSHYKLEH